MGVLADSEWLKAQLCSENGCDVLAALLSRELCHRRPIRRGLSLCHDTLLFQHQMASCT